LDAAGKKITGPARAVGAREMTAGHWPLRDQRKPGEPPGGQFGRTRKAPPLKPKASSGGRGKRERLVFLLFFFWSFLFFVARTFFSLRSFVSFQTLVCGAFGCLGGVWCLDTLSICSFVSVACAFPQTFVGLCEIAGPGAARGPGFEKRPGQVILVENRLGWGSQEIWGRGQGQGVTEGREIEFGKKNVQFENGLFRWAPRE